MNRFYVPFYLNKKHNITIYYDYEAKHFFKSPGGKQSSYITILSGTVGVIVYVLLKDMMLDIGEQNALFMVLFSFIFSCFLTIASIFGIGYAIKKNKDKIEMIKTPSKSEVLHFVQEGEKWLKSTVLLILFLLSISLINVLLLLSEPTSGLLFLTNTLLWTVLFILLWGVRPLKRKVIYKRFKKELLNNEQELI